MMNNPPAAGCECYMYLFYIQNVYIIMLCNSREADIDAINTVTEQWLHKPLAWHSHMVNKTLQQQPSKSPAYTKLVNNQSLTGEWPRLAVHIVPFITSSSFYV
jgi:hypothetical protein